MGHSSSHAVFPLNWPNQCTRFSQRIILLNGGDPHSVSCGTMVNWPWVCLSQQTKSSQGWRCPQSPVLPQHIPHIINAADIVQAVPSTASHPQPQRPAEWMGWAPSPRPGPLVLLEPREGGERLWEVLWPQAEATIWDSHANNPERASLQGEEKGQMHWDRQRK